MRRTATDWLGAGERDGALGGGGSDTESIVGKWCQSPLPLSRAGGGARGGKVGVVKVGDGVLEALFLGHVFAL